MNPRRKENPPRDNLYMLKITNVEIDIPTRDSYGCKHRFYKLRTGSLWIVPETQGLEGTHDVTYDCEKFSVSWGNDTLFWRDRERPTERRIVTTRTSTSKVSGTWTAWGTSTTWPSSVCVASGAVSVTGPTKRPTGGNRRNGRCCSRLSYVLPTQQFVVHYLFELLSPDPFRCPTVVSHVETKGDLSRFTLHL